MSTLSGWVPNLAHVIYDFSEAGIRLVTVAPLEIMADIEVGLLVPGLNKEMAILAVVIWTASYDGHRFWAGMKFRKELSYSEFFRMK